MELDRPSATLTPRQLREREFYREFADRHGHEPVNFAPIATGERRPWNPYWAVYHTVQDHLHHPGQRLLDMGCGAGEAAIVYAKMGYHVTGLDICDAHIEWCQRRAQRYGVEATTDFRMAAAEDLPCADNSYDVVVGIDVLHHVEVLRAVDEAYRVLKPGGIAVFREFVEVPIFDRLRSSRWARRLFPQDASVDAHRTEDERKLTRAELQAIRRRFANYREHRFCLAARIYRVIDRRHPEKPCWLERFDAQVFRWCPWMRAAGGEIVIVATK